VKRLSASCGQSNNPEGIEQDSPQLLRGGCPGIRVTCCCEGLRGAEFHLRNRVAVMFACHIFPRVAAARQPIRIKLSDIWYLK
jgi:hypothetical protein